MSHWTLVEMALAVGALGGLLRHIYDHGGIYFPHCIYEENPGSKGAQQRRCLHWPNGVHLGFLYELALGAGGGLVLVEGSRVPPIVLAIVGGFAGVALLVKKVDELLGRNKVYTEVDETYKTAYSELEAFANKLIEDSPEGGGVNGGHHDGSEDQPEPTAQEESPEGNSGHPTADE